MGQFLFVQCEETEIRSSKITSVSFGDGRTLWRLRREPHSVPARAKLLDRDACVVRGGAKGGVTGFSTKIV